MKRYTLYQRTKSNQKFWYVVFVDDETGRQTSAKSVESLRKKLGSIERHHISKRSEAEFIVQKAIEKGLDGISNNTDPLFIDYLLSFWDYTKSPYIASKNADGTIRVGKDYAQNRLGCVKNYIELFRNSYTTKNLLGELVTKKGFLNELRCSQVKRNHIRDMRECLTREKGGTIWVNCKRSLSVPIIELIKNNILLADPMLNIETVPYSNKSTVGTFTQREVEKLIVQMFNDVKSGRSMLFNRGAKGKPTKKVEDIFRLDERIFLASTLSACTGMRKGEILAL